MGILRDSFVIFKNWIDAINKLPEEYQLETFKGLAVYGTTGVIPDGLSAVTEAMLISFSVGMENSICRYSASVENGKKGGRPPKNKKPNETKQNLDKPSITQPNQDEPTHNLNVNDNVNVNVNILYYLNEKIGTNFKPIESNLKFIRARLNSGYKEEDLKKVVDLKVAEWKGTDMQKYLRPETLFNATKFESYFNGLKASKGTKQNFHQKEYTKQELDAIVDNLDDVLEYVKEV